MLSLKMKWGPIKSAVFLAGVVLCLLAWIPSVHSQGKIQVGMNTTLHAFGEEVKSFQALGIKIVRIPLQWQLIRIRPGEYDWSSLDRFIRTARSKNIEVLFTIRTRFKEGDSKTSLKKDSIRIHHSSLDMEAWLHVAVALASRYGGQGVHYEIENDVNEEAFWKGTREEYLDLLEVGYDAIKKADPQARVLASAMGCGILENYKSASSQEAAWRSHDRWLNQILATKKFDVVNVHDYYFPNGIVANGMTFRSYLDHILESMKKSGLENRPVWITETGYVSAPAEINGRKDDGSPEKQARWLKEAYQQAFESGVERVYWTTLRDRSEPYFGSMGLEDGKENSRPSWNAFQQLINIK